MPPPGQGVDALTAEQCLAPAADGLIEIDYVRCCGRKHYIAAMQPLHVAQTAGPLA